MNEKQTTKQKVMTVNKNSKREGNVRLKMANTDNKGKEMQSQLWYDR